MLDPDAAQFRNVESCSADSNVTRGEVNGKNRLGAYVGFERFYYASDEMAIGYDDPDFSGLMRRCYGTSAAPEDEAASTIENDPAVTKIVASPTAATATGEPMDDDFEGVADASDATPAPRCWDDYCPCDRSDPDFGYLDVTICRNLRMGYPVTDDQFAIGAQSRDARRALREFDEKGRPPPISRATAAPRRSIAEAVLAASPAPTAAQSNEGE